METADVHSTSVIQDTEISDTAIAGTFTPESLKMPDWKKELLLKRKSRTTENATATPAGSMSPSADAGGLDEIEGKYI